MEYFNEEHSKLLLSKEWLVKVDMCTSTPYLVKFYSSSVDLTCCILVTDTKSTWAEVLSSKQFARRWRECNRMSSPLLDGDKEVAWRTRTIDLLSRVHTLGGMSEVSFEVGDSKFADLAFNMECAAFKWRWEPVFVGHKASADILSKHLIMPLISVNHLAFSSSDPVGDLAENELEKAIDKVGRTARRTVDTHVKNALSKPRLATTLRRMTAVFNFISDLPVITTATEDAALHIREPTPTIKASPERLASSRMPTQEQDDRRDVSGDIIMKDVAKSRNPSLIVPTADSDSATESDEAGPSMAAASTAANGSRSPSAKPHVRSPLPSKKEASSNPESSLDWSQTGASPSDTESSPIRPPKKAKPRASSSDGDSEEERRKLTAQIISGTAPKRGTRQPLKRGGKRF
ncbi:hypothetical protein F5I97DRAFT_1464772 [Phlebopus sp. FC_14]|nr:hypothetical protein F5I97DRAFT_1464772 [Phlebopus sp. FC_14]